MEKNSEDCTVNSSITSHWIDSQIISESIYFDRSGNDGNQLCGLDLGTLDVETLTMIPKHWNNISVAPDRSNSSSILQIELNVI